jgi:hypothetical protein
MRFAGFAVFAACVLSQPVAGAAAGYGWPVARGCMQRLESNPNFGNDLRLRADGTKRPHLGVDIAPPDHDHRAYAANAGVVIENSPARGSGWGNYVVVRHRDGLRTLYAHLATPSPLQVGTVVAKGDALGTAGQTETFYVHVHFEILSAARTADWRKGRLDPASLAGPVRGCRNSAAQAGDLGRLLDMPIETLTNVPRAIQLALAPVFLLTGIAGLLNVMSTRLSRIIDRGRMLTERRDILLPDPESLRRQVQVLERRRHFTSVAITACTIAALLLCMVVAALFLEGMLDVPLGLLVGGLFMGSTLALVVGLAYFLREVHLATQLRIRIRDGR